MRTLLKLSITLALAVVLNNKNSIASANRPPLESLIISRSRNLKSPRVHVEREADDGGGGGGRGGSGQDIHLVNGMIDIVLSTLESKLRRVENLDRATQLLMRKVDSMGSKFGERTQTLFKKLEEAETRQDDQFKVITGKLDYLAKKFDSVCEEDAADFEEDIIALPSIRSSRLLPVLGNNPLYSDLGSTSAENVLTDAMDEVKETVSGMDRRLAFHINIVAENLGKMSSRVEEVHKVLVDDESDVKPGFSSRRKVLRSRNGTVSSNRPKRSKLDQLLISVKPLNRVMYNVREKVDEMRGMILSTKTAMDELVPKSNKILQQSLIQDRTLTGLKTELEGKTSNILEELEKFQYQLTERENDLDGDLVTQDRSSLFLLPSAPGNGDLDSSGSAAAFVAAPYNPEFNNLDSNDTNLFNDGSAGITRGPSVIFPSVENKPIVINSSFTYDTGANLDGIQGYNCADLYEKGLNEDGIYYLQIGGTRFWYLKVFCEMQRNSGGWTVIQRRNDYKEPRTSFNKNWEEYKFGFGDPSREFWLGNENIHMLTRSGEHELRIELEDFEGNVRYAEYKSFRLGSEKESYRLEIGGYQGNAGDSLNDPWYGSNLRPFSTYDNDNDRSSLNCASMLKGGWWWKSCGRGLNGLYLEDPQDLTARQGIVWFRWRGWDYSLKRSQMMIRPKKSSTEENVDASK